jgi:cysteine desulfurase
LLAGASPREIIFTSGATEANNMAIKGVASFYGKDKKHIITLQTEHKCVLDSCRVLQQKGFEITYLGVDSKGLVNVDEFREAIRPDTVLASIMFVNNEIGVIQPIQELSAICREHKVCKPLLRTLLALFVRYFLR